jgi:hypothetical protein
VLSALTRKAPKTTAVSNKKQKTTSVAVRIQPKEQSLPAPETELPASFEPSQEQELSSAAHEQKLAASSTVTTTSSMKRHHVTLTDARKRKMDALLEELEHEKIRSSHQKNQPTKGSFVQPGEENSTTNLFVGNLAPSITEEQLTDLFSQFGEKKSQSSLRRVLCVFGFEFRALGVF